MALSFQPVHSGEYDFLDEKPDMRLRQEAEEWIIRGEALVRRIERLLREWRTEKNRDLGKAAVQQAIYGLDQIIRRERELKRSASDECRKAGIRIDKCETVARHKERLGKFNRHKKKLSAMMEGRAVQFCCTPVYAMRLSKHSALS